MEVRGIKNLDEYCWRRLGCGKTEGCLVVVVVVVVDFKGLEEKNLKAME